MLVWRQEAGCQPGRRWPGPGFFPFLEKEQLGPPGRLPLPAEPVWRGQGQVPPQQGSGQWVPCWLAQARPWMSGPLVSARAAWGWGKGQPLLPHTPSPPLCPGHRWGPCPHSRDVGDSRPLSQGVQSQLPSLGRAQAGPLPGLPLAAAAPCRWPARRSHAICPCPVCPSKPLLWALSLDRFVLGQRLLTRSYICACWLLARLLLAQAGNPGPQAGRQAQALT